MSGNMSTRLISIREARERVLGATARLGAEPVEIDEALDRVLAEDLTAAADVPPFPCSAMDGFAVRAGPAGRTLTLVGESRAGMPASGAVGDGEAIRISTGAALPAGASAVIRQEDVAAGATRSRSGARSPPARTSATPARTCVPALPSYARAMTMRAAELGAAVAAGAGRLLGRPSARASRSSAPATSCAHRATPSVPARSTTPTPRCSTPWPGTAAHRRLRCGGCATTAPPPRRRSRAALEHSDVVIVTGGVSVGPHDHVKPALAASGSPSGSGGCRCSPASRPGSARARESSCSGCRATPSRRSSPTRCSRTPRSGRCWGRRLKRRWTPRPCSASPSARNPAREQAVRVRLERRDGDTIAIPNGPQGSHILSSLVGAHALALIPAGDGELAAGERVALEHLPH